MTAEDGAVQSLSTNRNAAANTYELTFSLESEAFEGSKFVIEFPDVFIGTNFNSKVSILIFK